MAIDLHAGVSELEINALKSLAEKVANKDAIFVNVGVWKGHTTSVMANVAKDMGGHVYAVDHWRGSPGSGLEFEARDKDIYSIFMRNMEELNLLDFVSPIPQDSVKASAEFADESVDLVFLDADHIYKEFKKDLIAWMPKIRKGGIICGHDCEKHYSECSLEGKDSIERNLDLDFIGIHPGIIKGLWEYFDDDFIIMPETRVWYKVIV